MKDRSEEKSEIELVLFILSIVALAICIIVLIPVVHSVNQQKDKVLSLFCEIDNNYIKVLAFKCEKFINSIQTEEGNEDIDSSEELEANLGAEDEDEYGLLVGGIKRVKKAKGNTRTDKTFFLKFIIAMLCIQAYYLQNFLLG